MPFAGRVDVPLPRAVPVAVADDDAADALGRVGLDAGVTVVVLFDDPFVGYEMAEAVVDVMRFLALYVLGSKQHIPTTRTVR